MHIESSTLWIAPVFAVAFFVLLSVAIFRNLRSSRSKPPKPKPPRQVRKPGETVWLIDHQDYLKDPPPPDQEE